MQDTQKNNIFTKSVLTVLLSFIFLSPISLSITAEKALAQNPPADVSELNNNTFEINNTGVTSADSILNQQVNIRDQTQISNTQAQGTPVPDSLAVNKGGWEQTIGNAILQIAAYITYFGGSILQFTINQLVFEMGTLLKDGIGYSIDSIWSIIRDICNLVFIFGFIYVGIRTIINPDSADTKRFLAQIIIGALLINFSLFFTKIVIDFSNFSAVQIYNAMIDNPGGDISYAFAQKLGVTSLYTPPSTPDQLAAVTGAGHLWFYVMGAIMLVVAGFVLAAGGILLVVRFVALILIMMFSPILFAATIFPQTEKYAKELWEKLISYSFFAPVYLLLLIASLKVLEGATTALGIGTTTTLSEGLLNGKTDSYGVILNFVIVIMFLIFSLQVAQRMGIRGGEMAVSAGNAIRGKVQGAIGRNTVGRVGEKLAKSQDESRKSNSRFRQFYAASLRGTGIDAVAQSAKKAKFGDSQSRAEVVTENKEVAAARARNKTTSDISDAIAKSATIDADPNASQSDKDTARVQMERAVANASTDQLLALLKKHESNTQEYATIVANMSESQVTSLTNAKQEDFDDGKKTKLRNQRRLIAEQRYSSAATRDALSRANTDELASMSSEFLSREEHAMRLNSSQMDDLRKKLTKTEFTILSKAREKALESLAQGTIIDGKGSDHILNQKPGEIAKMPAKVLVSLADKLSVATLTKIVADGTLSKTDEGNIRTEITNAINTIPANATPQRNAELAVLLDFMTNTDVGKRFGN